MFINKVRKRKQFTFRSTIDPFYFSFTTMSTIGYGDIVPLTKFAKMVVMSQQMIVLTGLLSIINRTIFPTEKYEDYEEEKDVCS